MITTDRVKAITAVALVLTLCAAWNTLDRLQLLLMLPVPMVRGGAVAISNFRNTLAIVFSLLFSWGVVALAWLVRAECLSRETPAPTAGARGVPEAEASRAETDWPPTPSRPR